MPIVYYLNLTLIPVFFILIFLRNWFKMTKQTVRWTVADIQSALDSNFNYYKQRKNTKNAKNTNQ